MIARLNWNANIVRGSWLSETSKLSSHGPKHCYLQQSICRVDLELFIKGEVASFFTKLYCIPVVRVKFVTIAAVKEIEACVYRPRGRSYLGVNYDSVGPVSPEVAI